jgi:hypothetical protein
MTHFTPSGRAIIVDRRRGYTYLASMARCGDQAVVFIGRLQHKTLVGEIVRPERTRTLPLRDVAITWLDESEQLAA